MGQNTKRAFRRAKLYAMSLRRPTIALEAAEQANTRFERFNHGRAITLKKNPIFTYGDVFFAMGSCFAEEIRRALVARGIRCVPRYAEIEFDPAVVSAPELPADHLSYYNTFSVRQQLEQAFELWSQSDQDYWQYKRSPANPTPFSPVFQDPYKRMIRAATPELLSSTLRAIDRKTREAFEEATAFLFTFGMTEVFVNRHSGKIACQKPAYGGGGGEKETTLHVSTFAENLANVLAIIDLIRSKKPAAPIVMSVSPVHLGRTFQDDDVFVVSTEGKSLLRAVLGQACRERPNVHYLPSYELVGALGFLEGFKKDMRHVERPVVDRIVGAFFDAFFKEDRL